MTRQSHHEIEAFSRDLTAAIRQDRLVLHWQPIASLRTGDTLAFEALLRWTDPERGFVPPDTFIPFAESYGLIEEIDAWVFNRACLEAARWPVPLRLSVNVSARTFLNPDYPKQVRLVAGRHGIAPERLEIEVTERIAIANTAVFSSHVRTLGAMGARVVLDDFGAGFSSLGMLGTFPVHKIKLDRGFVRRLGIAPRAEAVLRSVLELGRALDLVTCAEGIERDNQLAVLQRHGCREVQGYLIGRPGLLTARDFPSDTDALARNTGLARQSRRPPPLEHADRATWS